jgi:hypothetical protein
MVFLELDGILTCAEPSYAVYEIRSGYPIRAQEEMPYYWLPQSTPLIPFFLDLRKSCPQDFKIVFANGCLLVPYKLVLLLNLAPIAG